MAIEHHISKRPEARVMVDSEAQFIRLCKEAKPGTVYNVATSLARDSFTWRASGERHMPIWLDFGEQELKDVILTVDASWVYIAGGKWNNSQITLRGYYCRVTRCHFPRGRTGGNKDAFNSAVLITGIASHNRVDHCLVENWVGKALRQARIRPGARDNLFDHNHMRKMSDGKNRNGRECMQIGSGPDDMRASKDTNTQIIYNLIEDYDLEAEMISIKANDSVVGMNTFKNCRRSYVQSRTGSRNKIISNYMRNTRGILIHGDDNVVKGNDIEGNSRNEIGIRSGDCTIDQRMESKFEGGHPVAQRTLVVGNRVVNGEGIQIGEKGGGKREYYDQQWFPALGTMLAENEGTVRKTGRHRDTKTLLAAEPYEPAVELTAEDVGLHAPDPYEIVEDDGPKPPTLEERVEMLEARVAALEEANCGRG